jgi:hypothetical protein
MEFSFGIFSENHDKLFKYPDIPHTPHLKYHLNNSGYFEGVVSSLHPFSPGI